MNRSVGHVRIAEIEKPPPRCWRIIDIETRRTLVWSENEEDVRWALDQVGASRAKYLVVGPNG